LSVVSTNTLHPVHSEAPDTEPDVDVLCEERLSDLTSRLRLRGLRVTSERLAVLRVLLESGIHPCAEEIWSRVQQYQPSMSLGTVYSTLALLAEMGEALEIQTFGGKCYDGRRPTPHPHLVCVKCHEVCDLNMDVPVAQGPLRAMLEKRGYEYVESCVRVLGLCPRCREQERLVRAEEVIHERH